MKLALEEIPRRISRPIYTANLSRIGLLSKFLISIFMWTIWFKALQGCDYSFIEMSKYLTYWAWTIESFYFLYSFYIDCTALFSGSTKNVSKFALTFCHSLSEISVPLQVLVFVFYWSTVYPHEVEVKNFYWNVTVHGVGTFLIFSDY